MEWTRCLPPIEQWRAPTMKWTRYLVPIQEWRRCPTPIPVERTVQDVTVEVPSTDSASHQYRSGGAVLHRFSSSRPLMRQQWRFPAPIVKWTRCLAPIEQWRCPAPILMKPTVNARSTEVPSTDNGEDDFPRTDRAVEVSCTDFRGADR